jgi:hypothetical protein
MTRWREGGSVIERIFVVKNSLQTPGLPPKVPSPEEMEEVGPMIIGEYPQ